MQMLDHIIDSNHIDALSEVRAWLPAQCGVRWLLRSMGQAADCWTHVLRSLPPTICCSQPRAPPRLPASLHSPPPSWTCSASKARPCQAGAHYS